MSTIIACLYEDKKVVKIINQKYICDINLTPGTSFPSNTWVISTSSTTPCQGLRLTELNYVIEVS